VRSDAAGRASSVGMVHRPMHRCLRVDGGGPALMPMLLRCPGHHLPRSGASDAASRRSPRNVRALTVPRGSSRRAAISDWL
jgi:hypothetical protein